jgi:hypothetical protein
MHWLAFVAGTVLSWGVYGAMLHQGQVALKSPMRALLCVGVAYFLVGVLVPVAVLMSQGDGLRGFTMSGTTFATMAGILGAIGAVGIIFAFRSGGHPTYVHNCRASAEGRAQPVTLRGVPRDGDRRGDGAVLQAAGMMNHESLIR